MQMIKFFFLLFISLSQTAMLSAQYTATDFTVTDIHGNEHHLFEYLDEGKSVLLDFFAPWCGPCIDDFNSGVLQEIYQERGPGTAADDVVIISMETDPSTDDFWTFGYLFPDFSDVPYPAVDLQAEDFAALENGYGQWFNYWPNVLAICPDRAMFDISITTKEEVLSYLIVPKVNAGEDGVINCHRPVLNAHVTDTAFSFIHFSWAEMLPNGLATNPPFPYNELNPEVTETGKFVLSAKNIVTNCGNVDTVTISGIDLDPPLLFSDEDSLVLSCLTDTIDIFTNGLWGGGVWERSWETSDGNIIEIVDSTAHHIIATGAGTYTTTTYENLNGCSSTISIVVSDATPIELVSFLLENASPGQSDGAISLEAAGGTGGLSFLWNIGLNTPTIMGLASGNYSCTIFDENGCELIAGPYEILDGPSAIFKTDKYGPLKIYPNPSEGLVYIILPSHFFTDGFLSVFDLYGKLVFSETLVGNKSERAVDLSGLVPGIYHMVLQNGLDRAHGRVLLF